MLITSSPTITKQDVRQNALRQLQYCKKRLITLEAFTAKMIETSQQLWVSKNAIETYEHCQALYQSIDKLTSLVNNSLLSSSTSLIQKGIDKIPLDPLSTLSSPQ